MRSPQVVVSVPILMASLKDAIKLQIPWNAVLPFPIYLMRESSHDFYRYETMDKNEIYCLGSFQSSSSRHYSWLQFQVVPWPKHLSQPDNVLLRKITATGSWPWISKQQCAWRFSHTKMWKKQQKNYAERYHRQNYDCMKRNCEALNNHYGKGTIHWSTAF